MSNITRRAPQPELLRPQLPAQIDLRAPGDESVAVARRLAAKLLKKKWQIVGVFLLVLVPAAIATFMATPLYRSTALVQVSSDAVQVVPYRDVADVGGGAANFENFMGTQEQILKGAGLRVRVAARLSKEFANDPAGLEVEQLADRFAVKKIEKSQLFELSYQAPAPETAARVVNVFAEEFAKQHFEIRQATRVKAEQQLKAELEDLEKRLQLSERELMAYAQANNIMSLEQGQVDPLQQRLSILTQQLAEAEGQFAGAKTGFDSLRRSSVGDFPQRFVTQEIAQLQSRLLQLEQELTTLRGTFGENWPGVVEKRNEAALVREQLVREKGATLARQREQARLDLEAADARRRMAQQNLSEQKALVNQFHDASTRYSILKREVDTNRNLYEGLLERLRQTGVLAGLQFGNIQVVEPGRPNRVVDTPKVLVNLGIAALLGLALALCLVILSDTWDTSISTLEDAEQLAPLAMLGTVPFIRPGKPAPQLTATGSASLKQLTAPVENPSEPTPALPFEVTESIAAVCASILLSRSDERPRVIMVTSAGPGEGKTTIAGHLGRAFAELGAKTLLVEADMRKPDLSRSFEIGAENGLSLYLAGHVSPTPKIHETSVPNLSVTAGGPVPPNPAALLHSARLAQFLETAAANYQIVLLDAPPVLSMADARVLSTKADGVVLVVRAGKTARNLVRRAWGQLESAGGNVLGMVLNGWEPNREEMSHYRYYDPRAVRSAKSA